MAKSNYFADSEEPIMSIDKFSRPIVLKNEDYAVMLIIRLILMEPGLIQTHPDMGVGLVSRFRYSTAPDMNTLAKTILDQINNYLPQFSLVNVKCDLDPDTKLINIYITSEQLKASFNINTETGDVITEPVKLENFKK